MEILSYEELKSRCMAAMPEGIDTREGSLIDTAVGPVCAELASAYLTLQSYYDLLFPDTSAEGYLDRIAAQYGISRGEASPAEIEAAFEDQEGGDFTVPAGMRFSLGGVFYLVSESWAGGGRLRCETAGEAGNQLGELLPCDYLTGFGKAEAVEVLTPGEEREDDESLRARVLELLAYPAFGGNVSDYKEKVRSLPGVGGVRVTPVVSGGGTVGIEVLGSDLNPAGESLLEDVRELLIPGQQGERAGDGADRAHGHCLRSGDKNDRPVCQYFGGRGSGRGEGGGRSGGLPVPREPPGRLGGRGRGRPVQRDDGGAVGGQRGRRRREPAPQRRHLQHQLRRGAGGRDLPHLPVGSLRRKGGEDAVFRLPARRL